MRLACLVVAAACGSSHAKPDAAVPPRCDPTAQFGAPIAVAGLDTAGDELGARLTPDELVVVFAFAATAGGKLDLYTAARATADAAFGTPVPLGAVNSVYDDSSPALSPDQLLLFLDSDRGATGMPHIYASARPSIAAAFGPPTAAVALSDGETTPMLANAGALYFASDVRPGLGMHDLWRADVDATGATGTPAAVPGMVDTSDDEQAPAVTPDELAIYFERTTAAGTGIYEATRTSAGDPFGAPVVVASMAAAPSWISPDQCDLYFDAPGVGQDVFLATRE
ncbi:MAG TPA: hypothetical protein VGF94_05340 [Kofleriaceae bacterium]|jgi:hypothetical protein